MSSVTSTKTMAEGGHRAYYVQKIKTVLAGLAVHQKVFSADDVTVMNHCLVLIEKANGVIDRGFQVPTNAIQPLSIALKNPYALLAMRILQEVTKGETLSEQCKPYFISGNASGVKKTLRPEAYGGILTILFSSPASIIRVYSEYLKLLKLAEAVCRSAQPPPSPVVVDGGEDVEGSPIIIPANTKNRTVNKATTSTTTTTASAARPTEDNDDDLRWRADD